MRPKSPPVRVEVRIGGKLRFANDVYEPSLVNDELTVLLTAALKPTMVPVQEAPAGSQRDEFAADPRNGTQILMQIHNGVREAPAPPPTPTPVPPESGQTAAPLPGRRPSTAKRTRRKR